MKFYKVKGKTPMTSNKAWGCIVEQVTPEALTGFEKDFRSYAEVL